MQIPNFVNMLVIYTPQITNRIRYVFDLFFKEQMQVSYKLTSSMDEFRVADGAKLVYDSRPQPGVMCFGAVYLLFQRGITKQELTVTEYDYLKIFFQVEGEGFCLPFDPFAAAFYLVSRYEEYLPHANDRHDRFPPEESFAYRNGFLNIPVVNHYIKLVQLRIQEHYPELKFAPRKFKYKPTFDIDSAYNYRGKGPFRNFGGLARSVIKMDFGEAGDRLKVLTLRKQDPYDTYDYILNLHEKYDYKPVFFFLLGDYDEYDKGISVNVTAFQSLIKSIADRAEVGIHPSYASNSDTAKLQREIRRLNRILKREIRISRQHFLKLKFPDTYRNLMDNDIEEDYTIGYAALPGFRASICSSFYFYDLSRENKTLLKLYPFAFMDATLNYYMKLKPHEALEAVKPLIDEVKDVNGMLITLWHNNSFSEEDEWEGWRHMYEQMLEYIKS